MVKHSLSILSVDFFAFFLKETRRISLAEVLLLDESILSCIDYKLVHSGGNQLVLSRSWTCIVQLFAVTEMEEVKLLRRPAARLWMISDPLIA